MAIVGALAVGAVTGLGLAATELGLPAALQVTAIATAALSYGAMTAGLASATVSLAQRGPPDPQLGPLESAEDLLPGGSS